MAEGNPIEKDLVEQALALTELSITDSKVDEHAGNVRVRIVLAEDPELLRSCAFGLIYSIGALSFRDARPRGASGMHYQETDHWTAADMIRHLCFERGELHFYADYVRGRMMKTTVEVNREGRVLVETMNRGEAATRWVATLQGKRIVSIVGEGPDAGAEPEPTDPTTMS